MRWGFLAAVVADAMLVAVLPAMSPGFWLQPGSLGHLWPALVMFSIYGAILVVASARRERTPASALRFGSMVGLALGVVEMANIAIESYSTLSGSLGLAITAPLILGPFVVWGWVAARTARRTRSWLAGTTAALWSAMVTMLTGVTFGMVVLVVSPDRLAHNLKGDPDFLRSGWTDLQAFTLANTFDNAATHLIGALIVGAVVGTLGGAAGVWRSPPNPVLDK